MTLEPNTVDAPIYEVVEEPTKTTEEEIREYFADVPIMIQIARCESQFRQFDGEGKPLRGIVNNKDVGVMQINEYYHLSDSKRLGYDVYTLEGNLALVVPCSGPRAIFHRSRTGCSLIPPSKDLRYPRQFSNGFRGPVESDSFSVDVHLQ